MNQVVSSGVFRLQGWGLGLLVDRGLSSDSGFAFEASRFGF